MYERWTIKALESLGDREFVRVILTERLEGLTNANAPLSQRLLATLRRLERADILEDGRERFAHKDADGRVVPEGGRF
jgi:hypothetical protein